MGNKLATLVRTDALHSKLTQCYTLVCHRAPQSEGCRRKSVELCNLNILENKLFLFLYVGQLRYDSSEHPGYFIGLNDLTNEGTYAWLDGSPV